jgi:hypothetical protein
MASNRREQRRSRRLIDADVGKPVATADGEVIGTVVRIEGSEAYIRPNPGVVDGLGSFVSRSWRPEDHYCLDCQQIARVADDKVVLQYQSAVTNRGSVNR